MRSIAIQAENGIGNYDVHRPVGLVTVTVVKGRNIRSPELGLPGNVGCRVFWDPTRFMSEKQKKKAIEIDESSNATHDIGATNFVYAMNPSWDRMHASEGGKRLKLLMPSQGTFFDEFSQLEKKSVDFPVLQPIGISGDLQVLEPWDSCSAAIVVEAQFFDLLNVIPGSEYSVGEVVVPFREVVKRGEVSGWYNISGSEQPVSSRPDNCGNQVAPDISKNDSPQLFLTVRWEPPPESTSDSFLETEREASYAIQEEMVRSAHLSRQQKEKFSLLVSSVGAFNSVRGISANLQLVQNSLGSLLDLIESCMHAFDFSVRVMIL